MAARIIAVVMALLGVLVTLGSSVTAVRLFLVIREHGIDLSTTITVGSWQMTMTWFLALCTGVFVFGLGLIGGALWFWTMPTRRG